MSRTSLLFVHKILREAAFRIVPSIRLFFSVQSFIITMNGFL